MDFWFKPFLTTNPVMLNFLLEETSLNKLGSVASLQRRKGFKQGERAARVGSDENISWSFFSAARKCTWLAQLTAA